MNTECGEVMTPDELDEIRQAYPGDPRVHALLRAYKNARDRVAETNYQMERAGQAKLKDHVANDRPKIEAIGLDDGGIVIRFDGAAAQWHFSADQVWDLIGETHKRIAALREPRIARHLAEAWPGKKL
jgi:hypothetical protein